MVIDVGTNLRNIIQILKHYLLQIHWVFALSMTK